MSSETDVVKVLIDDGLSSIDQKTLRKYENIIIQYNCQLLVFYCLKEAAYHMNYLNNNGWIKMN